jgi:hypothetical protein
VRSFRVPLASSLLRTAPCQHRWWSTNPMACTADFVVRLVRVRDVTAHRGS